MRLKQIRIPGAVNFLVFLVACTLIAGIMAPPRALAGETIRVAVASNFLVPVKALAQRFSEQSGHKVLISAGSTGKLYAQITNGAPYDVFLAANAREPRKLEMEGKAVHGSRFTYALGRLVLWSRNPAKITGNGAQLLKSGHYHRLAIANPRTAPYGAAAETFVRQLGVPTGPGSDVVRGENIGQAFQYTATGNTELGLVALSQIRDRRFRGVGSHWLVPVDRYPAIRQQAVLLQQASHKAAANAFLEFLKGDAAVRLISDFGYGHETVAASR